VASLALTFGKLRYEVQRYMGFGRNTAYNNLDAEAKGDVVSCIERGLRQFYNPTPMPNESSAHEWSFLRGEGLITTVAPFTTGTISSSGTTVNGEDTSASDSTEPVFTAAMVGRILRAENQIREIVSFTNSDTIVIDRAFDANLTASNGIGKTFEILANECTLPADFGGLRGEITYRDGDGYMPIKFVNESAIRMLRSQDNIQKDVPQYAAIIPVSTDNDGTAEQTYKLSLWPFPDKVYDLYFAYTVMVESVSDAPANDADDNNMPTGGMIHSETILASCLSVAEQMIDEYNNPGKMQARYQERLAASISFDRRNMLPDGFGYNADNSDQQGRRLFKQRTETVSYKDVLYP